MTLINIIRNSFAGLPAKEFLIQSLHPKKYKKNDYFPSSGKLTEWSSMVQAYTFFQ